MLARADAVAKAPKFFSGPVDLRCDIRQSELWSYSSDGSSSAQRVMWAMPVEREADIGPL